MSDYFRATLQGLRETTAALAQAGEANQQAIAASQQSIAALQRAGARIEQMADAAMVEREEHEDLRETVVRLEALVRELIQKSTPPS